MNANPMCRKGHSLCLVFATVSRATRAFTLWSAMLLLLAALPASAQTTLLSEGFEGIFPAANGWSVGDTNATAGINYWDDVNSSFGSIAARTGNWKGYCAGFLNGFSNSTNRYTNSMAAFMSKSLNLAGYTGANLGFWYAVPSIESCCDAFRVYVDSNQVFSANLSTPG